MLLEHAEVCARRFKRRAGRFTLLFLWDPWHNVYKSTCPVLLWAGGPRKPRGQATGTGTCGWHNRASTKRATVVGSGPRPLVWEAVLWHW